MKHAQLLIIIPITSLVFWHSLQFWTLHTSTQTAWLWALTLEAAALYLWTQPRCTIPALLLSALVIAGPLHHTASPILNSNTNNEFNNNINTQLIQSLEQETAAYTESLSSANTANTERLGWQKNIETNNQRISELQQQKRELITNTVETKTTEPYLIALIQALAFLGLWATNAHALKRYTQQWKRFPSEHTTVSTTTETPNNHINELIKKLDTALENEKINQREWADKHNINKRDVSLFRKHNELKKQQKRTASAGSIKQIEAALS